MNLKRIWPFGALAAIALLLAIPKVAAVLMMATLGLGFPLLGAGAASVYLAAALAGAHAFGRRGGRGFGLLCGLLAVLVVAVAPG